MHKQIKFLQETIDAVVDREITHPSRHGDPENRWDFLCTAIHSIQHAHMRNNDCEIVDVQAQALLQRLENIYIFSQHLCWRSHEHHFHTCLKEYVNCPITCLPEISEYLGKIVKELYTT